MRNVHSALQPSLREASWTSMPKPGINGGDAWFSRTRDWPKWPNFRQAVFLLAPQKA
uniref:Uncharacterized protein n=1 Tax=Oryza sativa subsp. japonica TaxID=39947 RepID=Q6H4T0_ORYSJ|nr:hypothetical protein [Oryza sativa Japonica Group]